MTTKAILMNWMKHSASYSILNYHPESARSDWYGLIA